MQFVHTNSSIHVIDRPGSHVQKIENIEVKPLSIEEHDRQIDLLRVEAGCDIVVV